MPARRVFVVVPVFNRWRFTQACIAALRSQDYPALVIVVADGGSTDGTRDILAKEKDVVLLTSDVPEWWSGSTARGIAYALEQGNPDDFVLLLNNDTSVANDYVSKLVAASGRHDATVGSAIRDVKNPDVTVEAGVTLDWQSYRFDVRSPVNNDDSFFDGADVLPGRGTLIPLRIIHTVGSVDAATFPHYLGDYDLTHRIKKAGFRIGVACDAVVLAYLDETGLLTDATALDLKALWRFLFATNSTGNFIDHWRFISRHCPPEMRNGLRFRYLRFTFLRLMLASPLRLVLSPLMTAFGAGKRNASSSRPSHR